jgi:hypothetical protein
VSEVEPVKIVWLCRSRGCKINIFVKFCSAPIQNSISRLPSRPWFVYQKWNPVGHGQEVTEGMVGKKARSVFPLSPEARRVLCVQSVLFKNLVFFC